MTTVTLTSASTSPWTAPAGVTSVEVQCWGEGGNGAHGPSAHHAGGGGGGGEFAQETAIAVTPGTGYTFTIGAGGSGTDTVFTGDTQAVTAHHGATATTASGGAGGTGSTNTTHFNGGGGGTGGSSSSSAEGGGGGGGSAGAGGAGGTGGNGGAGSAGSAGAAGSGSPGGAAGGAGGSASPGVGGNGTVPGSGAGGGGGGNTGAVAGGTGAGGQIVLTYTANTIISGTATLSGSGTLQATGAFAGSAVLSGSGTLTWSGSRILKATVLSGSGTLSGTVIGTINESVTLSGSGTLIPAGTALLFSAAALSGSGTISVPGIILGSQARMSGTGTLSIVGTGGTVQAASGTSSPYAYPGSSQVSVAPPGSEAWQYLGSLGIVSALTYSFICPGGADKMTASIAVPAAYRTQLFDPGWQVRITRGGHTVWTGKLDEPVPVAGTGWTLTAVGDGNRGTDFAAVYAGTWPASIPDDPVNEAISRGLPWVNPGIGTPSGMWLGQAQDSGSLTITDLLNLVCSRGGLAWYANSQPDGAPADLTVFPLPSAVNRLLVVTDPVARTLGGDINTIWIRYEISDGSASGTSATFGLTSVTNPASIAAHGALETYIDLSSAGVISAAQAQQVGNYVLAIYQRASFAGPFTASFGQLLNAGGAPVDPGTDQAGTVVRLLLTDFGYGGEVTTAPITFIVGAYLWDDFAQKATVTPYQVLNQSLSGLLSLENTLLTPVTTQS